MAKKSKTTEAVGGEVLADAKESEALEKSRATAGRSKPRKPGKSYKYIEELAHLQMELIKLQEWVRMQGLRVAVIFEGRDAAGKGGVNGDLNTKCCAASGIRVLRPGKALSRSTISALRRNSDIEDLQSGPTED